MNGYKSYVGIALYVLGGIIKVMGFDEVGEILRGIAEPVFAVGVVHKLKKIESP